MSSIYCDNCGSPIIKKLKGEQRQYRHHFCNGKCYGQWRSQYLTSIGYGRGASNSMYGRKLSDLTKQLISKSVKRALSKPAWKEAQSQRGRRNMQDPDYIAKLRSAGKRLWEDPGYRDRVLTGLRESMPYRKYQSKKPNRPESQLLGLLDTNFPEEWRYTGDGSFTLGYYIPDFVNCNGKKLVIELFGEYWHGKRGKKKRQVKWDKTEEGRKEVYKSFGFDCLVIWGDELKDPEKVIAKVRSFT